MDILETLCEELNIERWQAERAAALLDEGNTIPFIARYRKEATGNLSDVALRAFAERLEYLRRFEARREEIRAAIGAQDKLTAEVCRALDAARTQSELEDVYLPFRPKRKTRASAARARGLEDLALMIFACEPSYDPPLDAAAARLSAQSGKCPMRKARLRARSTSLPRKSHRMQSIAKRSARAHAAWRDRFLRGR